MKIFSQCKNKSQGGCTRSAQFMCFSSAAAGKKKKKKKKRRQGAKRWEIKTKPFMWLAQSGQGKQDTCE